MNNTTRTHRGAVVLGCALVCTLVLASTESRAQVPVSVQVQQSAWQLSDVQGDRLDVEITVSNQGQQAAENILLALPSGWSAVEQASRAATVRGDVAVWPLGSLDAGDSASLSLSVAAREGEVLPGMSARLVVGGRPVVLRGRPVRLAGDGIPTEFLGITPDADPTDPPVVHRAALLGGDPARIFAFVQRQIAHQPYEGSLHGARGALYGGAGNAVDRSNLLVALLRASGVPAGYRFGALDDAGVDRLAAAMFPPVEATDRGGQALSVEQLRAHPESLLELIVPEARVGLGDTIPEKLASIAAMSDGALEALLFESGALDEVLRARLRDHAWVEAWIDGQWVAMDPSFSDLSPGQAEIQEDGEPVRAMPEERRHKVSLRMVREQYQPIWGGGALERTAPSVSVVRGAGDLVGRSVVGYHDTEQRIDSGFFFYSLQQLYAPTVDIRDLERPGRVDSIVGESFGEFSSNFGGPLSADYTTGAWLQVELLAPGQAPGDGELHEVTLGDRLPAAVRFGAPFSEEQDFSVAMIDSLDTTALLIGAAHVPPRVASLAQSILSLQSNELQTRLQAREIENPDQNLVAEDYIQGRAVLTSLAEVMLLLHDSNTGERARLVSQGYRQRVFHEAPRVRVARHRAIGGDTLAIDLVRERVESVGAPGQLRRDRALMRSAYGSLATALEGAVVEAVAPEGVQVISTESVLTESAEAGIPMVMLIGSDGVARLDAGLLEVSFEARERMRRALLGGAAVMVPESAVEIGGALRSAWIEFAPDGATLGRLEDGTGGSAVEYGLFLLSTFCSFFGDLPACQTPVGRSFFVNLSSFNGRMFGLISGALAAVGVCSGGSAHVCEKLSGGGFQATINEQIRLAFMNLVGFGPMSAGTCTMPLIVANGGGLLVDCPACGLSTLLVEGICYGVTAMSEANNAVISAAIDPVQPARPAGIMDAQPGAPDSLHTALQSRTVAATLPRVSVSGTIEVQHARVSGALAQTWDGAPQTVLARGLGAEDAEVTDDAQAPRGDGAVVWTGIDQMMSWTGATAAALEGQGRVDLYAGLLDGALATAGAWDGSYALTVDGPDLALSLDTRPERSGFAQAGVLIAENTALTPDAYTVRGSRAALSGAFAAPLGTGGISMTLSGGNLALTGARGTLDLGGQSTEVLPNQGFGGADGTVSISPGDGGGDRLTLDLEEAHQIRIQAPEALAGTGRFEVPVSVETSLSGELVLTASAPEGWRVSWLGQSVLVEAGPSADSGDAELRIVARGPGGLLAARAVTLSLSRPDAPEVSLSLVEDLRNAIEIDGVRGTAWIVEVRHLGAGPGRYDIAATVSDPALRAELAGTTVLVEPGDARRLGLILRPSAPDGPWPSANVPLTLTIRATGDAQTELDHIFELPEMTHLALTLDRAQIVMIPGQTLDVPVHIRALGNAPVQPRVALTLPSGLTATLSPPSGPLAPGASETLTLSVRALALGDTPLPDVRHLTLTPAPTAFEEARGLQPASRRLSVYLSTPESESLVRLLVRAADDYDFDLVDRTGDVIGRLDQTTQDCDPAAADTLADEIDALVDALETRFGPSETTESLRARAESLRAEGCDALDDLVDIEGIDTLRRGPDLTASLRAPREAVFGAQITLVARVTNAGDAPALATQAQLQAGAFGALVGLHTENLPALDPGEAVEFEVPWTADALLGSALAVMEVDPEEAVDEIDRTNNRAAVTIQLLPGGAAPPGNSPPLFQGIPPERLLAGADFNYDPQVIDPDGDPFLVEIIARAPGLRLGDGVLQGRVNRPGTYEITLAAFDRYGAVSTQTFALDVTLDPPLNANPVITSRPGRRLLIESPWTYALAGFDPDGGALTWVLAEQPEGATLDGDAVRWTPTALQAGHVWFEVRAQDEDGGQSVQRFSVEVRETPAGPDLALIDIDVQAITDSPEGVRTGTATATIVNLGDQAAPSTLLALYEERDGNTGFSNDDGMLGEFTAPALASGEAVVVEVVVEGGVAFGENVLHGMIDADGAVAESDEANNVLFSGEARVPATHALLGYAPETSSLVLMAPDARTAYRVFDPVTGAVAEEGVLSPMVPHTASLAVEGVDLEQIVIESDAPVQAWLTREIFAPDFGGDFFHPAVNGLKVGRDFALYLPTLTPNNRLMAIAVEPAEITLEDADGEPLAQLDLARGQTWEPEGLAQGSAYRLRSTGDLVVQSASVTGFSQVPPADRARAAMGDVGRRFHFSVRSRGPGGGAVAIFGYEAAEYTLETGAGQVLASGRVARGGVAFHSNLGERLGLRLRATGDVSVLAGDMAQPGADEIGLMGEDATQVVGQGGVSMVVHSLSQSVGDTVVMAGPDGAALQINGEPVALAAYGLHPLEDDQVFQISASSPVIVQVTGGGDRHFDLGDVLRSMPAPQTAPRGVLWRVAIEVGACAGRIAAQGRVGNAGNAAIPADTRVELVEIGVDGERVLTARALSEALAPGQWVDFTLGADSAPSETNRAWIVRTAGVGDGLDVWTSAREGLIQSRCLDGAPVFTSVPPETETQGNLMTYDALAEDPEGQVVRYDLLSGPPGASMSARTGRLVWRAGPGPSASFVIRASDPVGGFALQAFDVAIERAQIEPCVDGDGDGFCVGVDCNDEAAEVSPAHQEILGDGIDNDCNSQTPDSLGVGAAIFSLRSDAPFYGPGGPVGLLAHVGNQSQLQPLAGVTVALDIQCGDGAPDTLLAPVPTLGATASTTLTLLWRPAPEIRDLCVVKGRLLASDTVLGRAETRFEILSALRATLTASVEAITPGDPLTLTWSARNPLTTTQQAQLSITAVGLPQAFFDAAISIDAGAEQSAEVPIDTAALPPSLVEFALRDGGTVLARTVVRVRGEAALSAPQVDDLAALDSPAGVGATPSPIVLRPLGPRPGGAASGGQLRAVWTPEALKIEIRAFDTTPEPDDATELRIAVGDASIAAAVWRGASSEDTSEGITADIQVTDGERVMTATIAPSVVGLERWTVDDQLQARIVLRDGPAARPRDIWIWATDAQPDDIIEVYGKITLEDAGGDPNPDPDPTMDPEPLANPNPDPMPGEPEPPAVDPPLEGGCDCQTVGGAGSPSPLGLLWILGALIAGVLGRRAIRPRAVRSAMVVGVVMLGMVGCDDPGSGVVVIDEDAGVDPDAGGGSDIIEPEPDIIDDEDVPPDVEDEPEPPEGSQIGEACVDDSDCRSGICLQGVDGSVCTDTCDVYDCPEGWICARYPGGARLCVPARGCLDEDGDEYGLGRGCQGEDCDDTRADIFPGATEVCDGDDNDCDGLADEGLLNACGTCGDVPEEVCDGLDNDCDGDTDENLLNACGLCEPSPFPEVCNGLDDDCDGAIDEGVCDGECVDGESRPCYGGPPETRDRGLCQDGAQICRDGLWSDCEGDTQPSEEVCDGDDNDCDGESDEALINRCGLCGPPPEELCNGEDDDCDGLEDEGVETRCGGCAPCGEALLFPGEIGRQDPALAPAPDGAITLGSGQLERHFLWVPNSDEDTISRWDTQTGKEKARYYIGENPSRTAVDLGGNVWVGNRGDGRATHIFTDTRDCVDRNGDGVIQTSRDLNGDGRITAGEMVGSLDDPLQDECVHCQVSVGTNTDYIRGVAVDADGFAWLGTWFSRELYKVNPDTCEVVAQISTATEGQNNALPVYGLVVDGEGVLWTASFTSGGCSARVDTVRGEVIEHVCAPGLVSYGIAVDARNRIWWGDYSNGVWFYDPDTGVISHAVDPENRVRQATGIVAGTDGMIYVAAYNAHLIGKLDPETGVWTYLPTNAVPQGMTPQTNPRGVTIDDEGHLWAICRGSSGLVKMTTDGEILGTFPIVGAERPDRGTGPYSYSDNTGFQLFNFTVRNGKWRHVFDAGATVRFVRMTWSPFVPEGTRIDVKVRAAATEAGLEDLAYSTPISLTEVDLRAVTPEEARFLDIEFVLSADDPVQRPVLRDIQIFFETADCRQVACPEGQLCSERDGGCIVLPRECIEDAACRAEEYCDDSGFCRQGCRLEPDTCPDGQRCDARTHLCDARAAECSLDLHCADGLRCTPGGFCDPGCRLDPDDCPIRFTCNTDTRACDPEPPECAADADCDDARFCGPEGTCLTGCRLEPDTCPDGQLCDPDRHQCVLRPPDCDPEAITEEICDGLDNDCDGQIDEEIAQLGESCAVGNEAMGHRVCHDSALMCRADASQDAELPTVIAGQLDTALLPEGHYIVGADFSYTGPLVIGPGADLLGDTESRAIMMRTGRGGQHIDIQGARLDRIRFEVSGTFIFIEDSTFIGVPGDANNTLQINSPLVFRGNTLENFTLSTGTNATATVERSRFVSTDGRNRWLATFRAPAVVTDNHGSGLNLVPRAQDGLLFGGTSTGSTVARNRLERLRSGVVTTTVGPITIEDNTLLGNDDGVRIEGAGFPIITNNFMDMSDPGHLGVGVMFKNLVQGGGAEVRGNRLRMGHGDTAFNLDLDVFQIASPSIFEDNDLETDFPERQIKIQGNTAGGELVIEAVEGIARLELSDHVNISRDTVATAAPGITIGNSLPAASLRLSVNSGATFEGQDLRFEDVGITVEAGSSVTLSDSHVGLSIDLNRYMVLARGELNFVGVTLEGTGVTQGARRTGRGIQSENDGTLNLTDVAVTSFDYGIVVHDRSQASLTRTRFENCAHGLWIGVTAVADPVAASTFIDGDPDLLSTGVELSINAGGRAAFSDTAFDIGAEDTPWKLDLDVFQTESPTTIVGSTYANDQFGKGIALRGVLSGGAAELTGFEDDAPMSIRETSYIQDGAQVTTGPDLVLEGVGTLIVRYEGTHFEAQGTTFRNLVLGVHNSAVATITDATFENTVAGGRTNLDVTAVANVTDTIFQGFERRQHGINARSGGVVTVQGGRIETMDRGAFAERGGQLTIRDAVLTNSVRNLYMTHGDSALTAERCTLHSGDPDHDTIGLETASSGDNMTLSVTDLHFDLEPGDVSFRFDLGVLRDANAVSFSGTTFEEGSAGRNYQIFRDIRNTHVTLAMLEPGQAAFEVIGDIRVYGTATLVMADGLRLQSTTLRRLIEPRDTSNVTVLGAALHNVRLAWRNTSTGLVDGAAFTADTTSQFTFLAIGDAPSVTVRNATFTQSVEAADNLWGIHVFGAGALTPTLSNNTFTRLLYGIALDADHAPVMDGNTFVECGQDIFER